MIREYEQREKNLTEVLKEMKGGDITHLSLDAYKKKSVYNMCSLANRLKSDNQFKYPFKVVCELKHGYISIKHN